MAGSISKIFCVIILLGGALFAQTATSESPEPLRSKIIKKEGSVKLWLKNESRMADTVISSGISSGKTLILEKNGYLHITFEPLVEMALTGPASLSFENLLVERATGVIRMLCRMERGTMVLKAPKQPGHVLLFTLKTPTATIDASVADIAILVDSTGKTTADVRFGAAKMLSDSGEEIKTVLNSGCRGTSCQKNPSIVTSAIPDSAKYAKIAASQKRQPSIGILSVRSAKKSEDNLEHVSNSLAQEFEKSTNAKILFLDDIRKLLHAEGSEKLLDCFTDSCISKIGSEAGIDIVIAGNLGRLGSAYILDLRMIDVLRDRLLNRTSISVSDDPGKLFAEIPAAIGKLVVTDTLLESVVESPKTEDTTSNRGTYQELVVWIFPGKFIMGSNYSNGDIDELPTHKVAVDGFYMDRFEVTRDEFIKAMGYNPETTRGCGNCPVTNVTWQEASEYCAKSGKRLPTEAEWEYACRAGTTTPYSTGVTLTGEQANFNAQKQSADDAAGRFNGKVVPVGDYSPNRWNLHDMHGNVAEWCGDWFEITYYGNSAEKNPKGPEKGTLKVVRGGSWNSKGHDCRSANRMAYNPQIRLTTIGFRCVKPDDGK